LCERPGNGLKTERIEPAVEPTAETSSNRYVLVRSLRAGQLNQQ